MAHLVRDLVKCFGKQDPDVKSEVADAMSVSTAVTLREWRPEDTEAPQCKVRTSLSPTPVLFLL